MNSIAAYYVFIAMNAQQEHTERRRAELTAPGRSRTSLIDRVRSLVDSARSTGPAVEPA